MKMMTEHGVYHDFAMFLEITDEQIAKLEANPKLTEDMAFMVELVKAKGDNIHVVQLTLNKDIDILGYVKEFLKEYKTVSWIRKNKFFIRRLQ